MCLFFHSPSLAGCCCCYSPAAAETMAIRLSSQARNISPIIIPPRSAPPGSTMEFPCLLLPIIPSVFSVMGSLFTTERDRDRKKKGVPFNMDREVGCGGGRM